VLLQAQQVGLMGSEHNFIIASLVSTVIHGQIILLYIVAYALYTFDEWVLIVFNLGHAHLGLGCVQVQRHQHHWHEVGEATRQRVPKHRVAVDRQFEPARTR